MDSFCLHKIISVWKTLVLSKKLQKINMKLVQKFSRYKNAKLFLKWVKQNKDLRGIKKKALNMVKTGDQEGSFLTI